MVESVARNRGNGLGLRTESRACKRAADGNRLLGGFFVRKSRVDLLQCMDRNMNGGRSTERKMLSTYHDVDRNEEASLVYGLADVVAFSEGEPAADLYAQASSQYPSVAMTKCQ